MKIPRHPTLIRRMVEARVKQLQAQGPVLAASFVQIAKHCGRPGCRCQKGHKHIGHYLTFKRKAKTHTVYVPLDLIEDVRRWIQEHRRLKKLSQEITQLSVAQVKGHVKARTRRAGRS